jgi:hypothetical protein
MMHVFCLGPLAVGRGPAPFVAFFGTEDRVEQPVFAESEEACFAEVRRRHPKDAITCVPELAEAGRAFAMEPAPIPERMRTLRAGIALTLASGHTLAPSVTPPVLIELVAASADFLAAQPWERFDSEALLHARVDGVFKGTWEASVLGSAGREYGVGLYPQLGTHAQMHAVRSDADAKRLRAKLTTMGVTFEDEPAYAARAIEAHTGVAFVPVVLRVDSGKMRGVEAKHALVLAAALRAAASSDRVGVASVAKLTARVELAP